MKVTLSEIKKNLQGTNSGVGEAKNQINDLEHKEGKHIQSEQQEEKRIEKQNKTRIGLGTSETSLNVPTSDNRSAIRRRGRARNRKLI